MATEDFGAAPHYFSGGNTASGFVSYYDYIFGELDRLYIIKGAPGTGKSKLMRDIANEAVNRKYKVEYYHCSSDPDSLDGIIIRDTSVGVLDGTAPHVRVTNIYIEIKRSLRIKRRFLRRGGVLPPAFYVYKFKFIPVSR